MLIGLFAIPEVLLSIEKNTKAFVEETVRPQGERLTLAELRANGRTIGRSTMIGAVIGMIPGVGQVVAALMAYAAAKSASKEPEKFGTGILEGVAAPESANNAVNGPTMVPLLTLGIPGDNITAILLGAFVVQGLRPGPQLFTQQAPLIYAILMSMLVCCVLLYVLGYLLVPVFSKVVMIRKAYLVPLTVVFAFVGTYVYPLQRARSLFPDLLRTGRLCRAQTELRRHAAGDGLHLDAGAGIFAWPDHAAVAGQPAALHPDRTAAGARHHRGDADTGLADVVPYPQAAGIPIRLRTEQVAATQ